MQKGIVITHRFQSKILKSNPLGDPFERDIIVYVPPGYKRSNSKGYIAAFGLAGFGGQGRTLLNVDPLSENIENKMNRLIFIQQMRSALVGVGGLLYETWRKSIYQLNSNW